MFHVTPLGIVVVTWAGWAWLAVFGFAYAVLVMVGFALILRALDNTRQAKERRAREVPAEARARIGELSALVLDGQKRERALTAENARLRGLVDEESNHGRNWRARVHAVTGNGG